MTPRLVGGVSETFAVGELDIDQSKAVLGAKRADLIG